MKQLEVVEIVGAGLVGKSIQADNSLLFDVEVKQLNFQEAVVLLIGQMQ